jgi:hypothetical protein
MKFKDKYCPAWFCAGGSASLGCARQEISWTLLPHFVVSKVSAYVEFRYKVNQGVGR